MPKYRHQQRSPCILKWMAGAVLLLGGCLAVQAGESGTVTPPRISIIIDDMGDQREAGERALQLPGAITYAFLPHTPHSRALAESAHQAGKEVMLHLPMQAMSSNRFLGPGALVLDMSRDQFRRPLEQNLAAVPHAVGINNHMGSLLTRHPGHMGWLMEALAQRTGLYFVDSRTTHHTVAAQLAQEHHIPSRQRDVFLDDDPNPAAILQQFNRLVATAAQQGSAIAIGHPYDGTLDVLEAVLPQLTQAGITLVPVSRLIHDTPTRHVAKQPAALNAPDALVYNLSAPELGATPAAANN